MDIYLELEKDTNTLSFIFGDKTDEYSYIYNYTLDSVYNINTLCIFLHNKSSLKIKKSQNNYLTIEKDFIEIKTNNSYVCQKNNIDVDKLHYELCNLLYNNGYISFSINLVPSEQVKRNHKIKKNNISEKDLQMAKSNLIKSTKNIKKDNRELSEEPAVPKNISVSDLEKKIKSLKKTRTIVYHPLHITNDMLEKQKSLLKHSGTESPNKLILEDVSNVHTQNDILIDTVLDHFVCCEQKESLREETNPSDKNPVDDIVSISSDETIECDEVSSDMEIEPLF